MCVVFLVIFAVYQYFNAEAKKSVIPTEPEPGDRVHTMDDGENYHGVK